MITTKTISFILELTFLISPIYVRSASVTFCNETDLGAPCAIDTINAPNYGCHLITDSNAKRDMNSSIKIDNNDNYHIDRCYLYGDDTCSLEALERGEWIEVTAGYLVNLDQQWIARSYLRYEKFDFHLPSETGFNVMDEE